ncbi:MAG: TetR/AcrR family transcriptional regulator [Ruminococcaceae bacterium]|nr:TetR/AcrR family transcriptional regulator [Oscillospiraceae bacterium]
MENKYINDQMSETIIQCTKELALKHGAAALNVRSVLHSLKITNRVFYNRFSNINEVLDIVYNRMVVAMREGLSLELDPKKDFFEQVKELVVSTLISSYQLKMKFSSYIFESDSQSEENYLWWTKRIAGLIRCGKERGILGDVDENRTAYAVWCFIRGYNADALTRGIPLEQAIDDFKYSFGIFLNGMRKED